LLPAPRSRGFSMRVAFLSDIHASFPALCAALEHARAAGADRVLCAGDLVGGGPHPTEVIRLLMEQRISAVAGNVDRKVCALAADPKKLKRARDHKKRAALAWTAAALGRAELEWLAALPKVLRLSLSGAEILVVHGAPRRPRVRPFAHPVFQDRGRRPGRQRWLRGPAHRR
jgi:predicted phosphodiesterase